MAGLSGRGQTDFTFGWLQRCAYVSRREILESLSEVHPPDWENRMRTTWDGSFPLPGNALPGL
jgi:hypothetical protein